MDAALAPLRLQGIHAMNYTVQAVGFQSLGLYSITPPGPGPQIELQEKCPHSESEDILSGNATGLCTMQEWLSPGCVLLVCTCLSLFRCGESVSVDLCRRLLSLMVTTSLVVSVGLLHTRAIQWWMRSISIHPSWSAHRRVIVCSCLRALTIWFHTQFLVQGVSISRCIPDRSSRAVRSLGSGPAGVSLGT